MTLSSGWDETSKVNAVTAIPGYSENSSSGGKAANSAIPTFFDSYFHGDFRRQFPLDLSSGLGDKSLEEYDRTFPNFRVNTSVEIGFDTDGQNISSFEVKMDGPSKSAPITLEGGPGEPDNPFRAQEQGNKYAPSLHFDGEKDFLKPDVKGPKTSQKRVSVEGVDGVRGSIIFGGSDEYLVRAKNLGIALADFAIGGIIPEDLATYYVSLPAFYTFVDFVFMADGTKVTRVWDTSFYPAHALYVDGSRQDRTTFDEGEAWTRDGANSAFNIFAIESVIPGRTPFNNLFGSFVYKRKFQKGAGNNPAMLHRTSGSVLTFETVESNLSSPLFPF